jgi:peptide/nickel transport system substrate-binding protein
MTDSTDRRRRPSRVAISASSVAMMSIVVEACLAGGNRENAYPTPAVLRVGVAQLSSTNPAYGLRQLAQNLSVESLLRPGEDGRLQPLLADGWKLADDGRSLNLHLRPGVKFHDGAPLNSATVVEVLPDALRTFMGPVFEDVEGVRASGTDTVEIRFRKPSPFLLEALEAQIKRPGTAIVGTGPYVAVAGSSTELRAHAGYYLGQPLIERIVVSNYPSVRAAWADMLRARIDMLYDVGTEALDSIEASTNVSTFTYTRHYQYFVVLNSEAPTLRSREVRRGLNLAIDRGAIVKDSMRDHGIPSSAPISPRYWALRTGTARFEYDPVAAARALNARNPVATKSASRIRFTCLVPPDALNERIALAIKRQLQVVGVDMLVEEGTQDQIFQRVSKRQFDAVLLEGVSGPTLFRPYLLWHSNAPLNPGGFGNNIVDGALDLVRHASSENEYRQAVEGLQRAFMDDPPAIFLAWSVRARSISKRFDVEAEEGRDVLSTLRLWKPTTIKGQASRN